MAARLEAAAKQYNVEILISGFLYTIVSRKMKHNLRHIDTVTVKGSNVPVGMN
jgi:class 3 adenylate cyclase